jgi:hypothetical protein
MRNWITGFVLVFVLVSNGYSAGKPGQFGLAAALIQGGGTEIALSKVATPSTMYLLHTRINYNMSSSESESQTSAGSTSAEGPTDNLLGISLIPEYRRYLTPAKRISSYWGIYALVGYMTDKTETPGATTVETTDTDFSVGGGLSFGVEYFLNSFFSVSAHTRLLQYTFMSSKLETTSSSGSTSVTNSTTRTSNNFLLTIQPFLYLRFYW